MSCTCKGICYKLETQNKKGGKDGYSKGEKFCSVCGKFMLIFSARCCCCNTILRTSKANKKSRGFLN